MKRAVIFLLLLHQAGTLCVLAGNTGKISGRVLDAKSREPIFGVNILIVGTTMGAATDLEGQYAILNIPPGIYALKASVLGYAGVTITGLRISIDLTTQQDFQLSEAALDVQEIVITAERPIIQRDLTASTAIIGSDKIAALPVTEVSQILSLQAGVVAGSVRGGRSGEVAYWIDGVPVTDAFNGSQVVEVNKNLVQELQLISGAFNAEYGQALSGIVNIATKEGADRFSGSAGTYIGQYATGDDKLFPGVIELRPTAIRNVELSLSGPLIGDKISFFANGRYIYFDGWLNGFRRFQPWNISYTDENTRQFYLNRDSSGIGDSSRIPMNPSERWYGQGKLTWKLAPMLKLNLNYLYDYNKSKAYNRSYFFNPDGMGNNFNTSHTAILQLTHTLNQSTFYTLGASFFDKGVKYYLYDLQYGPALDGSEDLWEVDSPSGSHYVHPDLFLTDDPYSFLTGGTDLSRFRRSTITRLAKLDLSSQIDKTNLIKIGIEFRKHNIFLESIQLRPIPDHSSINLASSSPFIRTRILPLSSIYHDMYNHSPWELSGYVQDKAEFKDFIVNIGVRFDYFEPDGRILNDDHPDPNDPLYYTYTVDDPNIYDPLKAENTSRSAAERRTYWYKKAKPKHQFSPRFGASFPITATGVVHFSYGHFFQIPRFERLYENPDFKLGSGTGNQGIVGNADLEPEQTINGEIGIQQQVSEDVSVDLTAYLRDVRNLTGTRSDEIIIFGGSASYNKYVNSDFGTIKGIVLTVNKRFSQGITASLDYTYQVARGSASDPAEARNSVAGGSLPEVQLVPLAWDQRHTLNATASYDGKNWGASMISQYGSGTPYTPRRQADITSLQTNAQTKPAYFNLDLRTFFQVPLDALQLVIFARVFNLLDSRNEVGVFDDTGRAGFTLDEAHALSTNPKQRINSIDRWYTIPTNYSEPRRIELGMNLEF